MRVTTLLRKIVGVTQLYVKDFLWTIDEDLVVEVRPRWRKPRCGNCGRRAVGYDRRPWRRWRHLACGQTPLWLGYAPRRVQCSRCGIRTEEVPWAASGSRFTWAFEELVAYLAQITDQTKVTQLVGIAWSSVGSIVDRVVERQLDGKRLDGLVSIGVDEFSYRKRHRYLTVVVDHARRRVVWAAEGRSAEVLGAFFEQLGPERCAAIEWVTMDMSGGYRKAVQEWLQNAKIVYDRFHVQRLASDALDEVRRSIVRDLGAAEAGREVKNSRFVLLKTYGNLSNKQRRKLSEIEQTNRRLYRAYLLKETLAKALDYRQPWRARKALEEWLAWASRSKLPPFLKVARTIRRHFDGILAYVRTRLTNGLVEGLNNKLRMVARRAFGFHSPEALISMIFLNCGGLELHPPLPTRS